MQFLTPDMVERINAGTVTHHDMADMLIAGLQWTNIDTTPEERAFILNQVRLRYPTQNDVAEHLRKMLAAYIRDCAPGTRQ